MLVDGKFDVFCCLQHKQILSKASQNISIGTKKYYVLLSISMKKIHQTWSDLITNLKQFAVAKPDVRKKGFLAALITQSFILHLQLKIR